MHPRFRASLLATTPDWMAAEHAALQQLVADTAQAHTVLATHRDNLQAHASDPDRPAEALGRVGRLLGRGGNVTRRHRDAVAGKELLGLVFVEVHGGATVSSMWVSAVV